MIEELFWNNDDSTAIAEVKSAVPFEGQLVIVYEGWDATGRYEGKIELSLKGDMQIVENVTTKAQGEIVPYELQGKFTNPDMTSFEGRWTEPGYVANFSF